MPLSHVRLTRALKLSVVFAVLAAVVVVTIPDDDHPPERIATTASIVPEYSGPTSDPHHELVVAVEAAQLAAFYTWASAQPLPNATSRVESKQRMSRPNVAPAPSGDALTAIAAHFGDLYDQAVGVARCESTLDPGAVSKGGGNWGLFQINTVHRDQFEIVTGRLWSEAILDADANAKFARWLYDQSGGWGPWSCRWAAG